MQLIDTPTGRYCIADGRDLGAFLKALKTASKPKRPRLSTARPVRRFPAFYAGETSTADYVAEYYALNFGGQFNELGALPTGAADYVRGLFGELPTTPAPYPTDEGDESAYMVAVC
jgi:hypothetical protein